MTKTPPKKVLKIDKRYPTMVAVFELLMKICTKLVKDIIAMAQPMKMTQSNTKEVYLKKAMSMIYLPKINIFNDVAIEIMKFTMKKLTQ